MRYYRSVSDQHIWIRVPTFLHVGPDTGGGDLKVIPPKSKEEEPYWYLLSSYVNFNVVRLGVVRLRIRLFHSDPDPGVIITTF